MSEAKPFCISKWEVWKAYKRVKANQGAAGVDEQSIADFEKKLKGNLYKSIADFEKKLKGNPYKIWNRMSSGSYFPPPVRGGTVKIPKASGGERRLGIPTVSDRIAQRVVKSRLEPSVEPLFHPDSYGYRPGKSAGDAVGKARQRCRRRDGKDTESERRGKAAGHSNRIGSDRAKGGEVETGAVGGTAVSPRFLRLSAGEVSRGCSG